jgi:hypothetical protein
MGTPLSQLSIHKSYKHYCKDCGDLNIAKREDSYEDKYKDKVTFITSRSY